VKKAGYRFNVNAKRLKSIKFKYQPCAVNTAPLILAGACQADIWRGGRTA